MHASAETRYLRLLLGGDVMLGRLVTKVIHEQGPRHAFGGLETLRRNAHLFFVNLECAISARNQRFSGAEKAFYFRADPAAVDVLTHAGVNLVSLANNHTLDAGIEGLRDTLRMLATNGIAAAGAGENREQAFMPRLIEFSGMRIGVLACCDHQEDFAATQDRPGIAYLNLHKPGPRNELLERVREAARYFDHLVVSLHWLSNWVPAIPRYARELARHLGDAGARIVWGHSPHHILGVEWRNDCVMLYATGDLLDDYALHPVYRNDRQLLYEVTLDKTGISRMRAYPVQLYLGYTAQASDEAADWIRHRMREACRAVGSEIVARDDEGALDIRPLPVRARHG